MTPFRIRRPRLRAAGAALVTILALVGSHGAPAATGTTGAASPSGGAKASPARAGATAARPPAGTASKTGTKVTPKATPKPHPTAARSAARPASGHTVGALAHDARSLEDLGLYAQAAEQLAELRGRVRRDADLELSLALDFARSGHADSAATILWGPALSEAVNDTGPLTRYNEYPWPREGSWLTGRFEGWHWYVARARVEVAAALRRWQDGYDAALVATRARPLAGKEWLMRSVLAGRVGAADDARASALQAVVLDPTLPEAQYVQGLWEWRDGHRAAAAERFRFAIANDSTYRPAALALSRVRLPLPPDSLPSHLLTGVRMVGLLSSPAGPKIEEFVQMDQPAAILSQIAVVLPDSLRDRWKKIQITPVVLVDESGRAVLNDLPWTHPIPGTELLTGTILATLPQWRFRPAIKDGRPHLVWAAVDVNVAP